MEELKAVIQKRMKDVPATSKEADRGILALRIGLGLFFIYYGLGKFFGFAPDGGIMEFGGMLGSLGFPVPLFFAYLVAFVELFGGITILLGFFTRASAILLAVMMLVGFAMVENFSFESGSVEFLAFAMALTLLLSGPGKLSFAERWYREDMRERKKESGVTDVTEKNQNETTVSEKGAIAGTEEKNQEKKENTEKTETTKEKVGDKEERTNKEEKNQSKKQDKKEEAKDKPEDDVIRL